MEQAIQVIKEVFGIEAVWVALALWVVYFLTKHVTTIRNDHSGLQARIEDVEQRLDSKIDAVEARAEKRFDKLDIAIDEIRKDIAYLKGSLDIFKNKQTSLMESHSPISLTEEGQKVAKEMGATEMIDDNWSKISKNLVKLEGANAYDIQTYCIETASVEPECFFDGTTIDSIKTFAYKKGMPLQLPLRLLGLMIRDRYFFEKGVPLRAVDQSTPIESKRTDIPDIKIT